jgi:hypothetical protein
MLKSNLNIGQQIMENQIKSLSEQILTIQKTLDWMIKGMVNAQSIKGDSAQISANSLLIENPLHLDVEAKDYN